LNKTGFNNIVAEMILAIAAINKNEASSTKAPEILGLTISIHISYIPIGIGYKYINLY
jgi:hypothetical protein